MYNKFYRLRKNSKTRIAYTIHAFRSMLYYCADKLEVKITLRTGKIISDKCTQPNKVCVRRYDGKAGQSLTVIASIGENRFKVITVWREKGN